MNSITINDEDDTLDLEASLTALSDTKKEPEAENKQRVTMHFNYSMPKQKGEITISLPSVDNEQVQKTFSSILDKQLLDNKDSREWGDAIRDALSFATFKGAFISTLSKPGSEFEQFVEAGGEQLCGRSPKFKKAVNENLKGSRAVMRVLEKRNLGSLFQTPLWNSGIWITFRPPSDTAIVNLNRQIASDKIELGRASYGLIFSNTSVYTINRLVDFALDHIQDTTLKLDKINTAELKKIISSQDIPTMLWGLACAMYPNGFNYRRACVSDPDKCQHVVEELLNLSKLSWINKKGLTDWQRVHMATRTPGSKTPTDIKKYKEELKTNEKHSYELEKGFNVILKTPVIDEYVEAGYKWIDSLVALVEESASSGLSQEEKNVLITRHGQATGLRQYLHWIDSLTLDSNVVDDVETLALTLDSLSSDEELQNLLLSFVSEYINSSTISVIGIPEFVCPACGTMQEGNKTLPMHSNIIPLDVTQLFFALIMGRMEKIAER